MLSPAQDDLRARIAQEVRQSEDWLVRATQRLIAAASPNPPGDTRAVADVAATLLAEIPGVTVESFEPTPGIVNLVARLQSGHPGRRLIFNGHLDTFPIGEDLGWTVPPLGGVLADGKLYGRGAADMKGGIAASLAAVAVLARHRDRWNGEIVVTLAGDEESMGQSGTRWLLDNVSYASGDAMICGDVGSPRVVRFGEKGLLWVEISAAGKPSHGAHVHKGVNAVDRLRAALDRVKALEDFPVQPPPAVTAAIAAARPVSEPLSGAGEAEVLQKVTVNIGTIAGGVSPNLVPASAEAKLDIRIPVGVSLAAMKQRLANDLGAMEGISWRIVQAYEPLFTPPDHEIVRRTLDVAAELLPEQPVANMRVGASDARLYRAFGIPSVVFGCTPYGMGGPDEHIEVAELVSVATVHTLVAFDFLSA